MWDTFLPALFQGSTSHITSMVITSMLVNHSGIALLKSTKTTRANWNASCVKIGDLVTALRWTAEFRSLYYALLLG